MRTLQGLPEGGCHVSDLPKFKSIDNTDPVGEGVTKEWSITYATLNEHWKTTIHIQHGDTMQEAFDVFIKRNPETYVKSIKYIGIYF